MATAIPDYSACHGCSLCLLVCPAWQQTRDVALTPKGVAKALQHQVAKHELVKAANACIVCGACNTVCPQQIDLMGMMLDIKGTNVFDQTSLSTVQQLSNQTPLKPKNQLCLFIPSEVLRQQAKLLTRISELLNRRRVIEIGNDSANDIVQAVASASAMDQNRIQEFLRSLKPASTIIVDDGLLFRLLKHWLPDTRIISLGAEIMDSGASDQLGPSDLYIINSRAYHSDYHRLRDLYARIQNKTGSQMNLDLQRVAQPTLADGGNQFLDSAMQRDHILEGKAVERIIVEHIEDAQAFSDCKNYQVMHVAELRNHD